jgi:fucose 4-O-acetylase-like acetyltransferase
MLAQLTSDKFRFWAFVSMVCLVFVHGYDLDVRRLQPATLPSEALTFTTFTEYFLANGILRFRMALLFLISGYLYALHDGAPNHERIRKRVRTLLVPYLLWSGLCLLAFYGLETIPVARAWIAAARVARIHGTHLLVHDYSWDEILVRWIVAPLPYQLWFLRVLFFYNLAYPWLRDWVTGATSRRVFFSVAILFWLGGGSLFFLEGEGFLFFSLGVWMQKVAFDIATPRRWSDPRTWGLVLVGAAALKTSLAFAGIGLIGDATRPVLVLLHKLTSASGLIAAWFGGDAIVRWCMRRRWFVWLTSFSFFIYAAHAPWVAIAIDPVLRELGAVPGRRLLTFVVLPSAILALTVLVGAALRALTPTAYGALTGGRGLDAAPSPAPSAEVRH